MEGEEAMVPNVGQSEKLLSWEGSEEDIYRLMQQEKTRNKGWQGYSEAGG